MDAAEGKHESPGQQVEPALEIQTSSIPVVIEPQFQTLKTAKIAELLCQFWNELDVTREQMVMAVNGKKEYCNSYTP